MKEIYYKVTYPDGDVEYWTSVEKQEVDRLEFVNGGKLVIEKVEKGKVFSYKKKELNMSKIGNYIIGIEEDVWGIEGLENKVSESENIEEVFAFVIEKLGLKTNFDIDIAKDAVKDLWFDFWGYY